MANTPIPANGNMEPMVRMSSDLTNAVDGKTMVGNYYQMNTYVTFAPSKKCSESSFQVNCPFGKNTLYQVN